jgi:hypothetical protein
LETEGEGLDGPRCALASCRKPLERRVMGNGRLESETDFIRRSYCSPECSKRGRQLQMRRFFVPASTY